MVTVTIDVAALDRLIGDAAEDGIREALTEAERILKTDILNRPGTGRKYGKHQASAPGEPPAPDAGNLRANTNADTNIENRMRYDMPGSGEVIGQILANAEYAEALEKGSNHTARSRTADALFGMKGRYGPARLSKLAEEVGTERTAARPFLSLLPTRFAAQLQQAFVRGAKR